MDRRCDVVVDRAAAAGLIEARAVSAEHARHRFIIRTSDDRTIRARAVPVASGLTDQLPAIPGLREVWASTVPHCPHCRGWKVRGGIERLVVDDGRLVGVSLAGGSAVSGEAVFIAPVSRPNDHVLRALGCSFDPGTGLVHTDPNGAASVPGVRASGDASYRRARAITLTAARGASIREDAQ